MYRMSRATLRERNRSFVSSVNAATKCQECGAQPIEWHHFGHCKKPNARVSSLVTQGCSIARIQAEMDVCEPLCRTCHMKVDGRMASFLAARPRQPGSSFVDPSPCSCCGRVVKPLRRSLCSGCYNHQTGLRLRSRPVCGCRRTGGEVEVSEPDPCPDCTDEAACRECMAAHNEDQR